MYNSLMSNTFWREWILNNHLLSPLISSKLCWLSSTPRPVVWVSHETQCPPCWRSVAAWVQPEVGHNNCIVEKSPKCIVYFWPTLGWASADRWPHIWLSNTLTHRGVHGLLNNCGCQIITPPPSCLTDEILSSVGLFLIVPYRILVRLKW